MTPPRNTLQCTAMWDLGFGINFGSRCFHRSRECSLAKPKPTQLQRASRLGLVVPMKKLLHSCKYSTGANRTILSRVQLQLPVKEGTPNYNIQFVSTFEDLNTPKKTLYGSLGLLRSQYTYEKLLYAGDSPSYLVSKKKSV